MRGVGVVWWACSLAGFAVYLSVAATTSGCSAPSATETEETAAPASEGHDEPDPAAEDAPQEQQLVAVELEDQFGEVHELAPPFDRVQVLAIADSDGSEALEAWSEALRTRFAGESFEVIGVADLSGVGGIARGFARRAIRSDNPDEPVLLDWDRDLVDQFDTEAATANLVLLDRAGFVRWQGGGDFEEANYEKLSAEVERLLAQD